MTFRKKIYYFFGASTRRATSRYIENEPKTTAYNDQVYPQIPFLIRANKYKIKCKQNNNPGGQLYNLTWALSSLFRDERVVLRYNKATELRPHVEMLIVEAMRNGDRHRPTMALANFWLREKNLVHKLFKVFVPRYLNHTSAFTALHMLGKDCPRYGEPESEWRNKPWKWNISDEAVLEMKGNNLPPIIRPKLELSGLLNNVLMDGARERKRNQRLEGFEKEIEEGSR